MLAGDVNASELRVDDHAGNLAGAGLQQVARLHFAERARAGQGVGLIAPAQVAAIGRGDLGQFTGAGVCAEVWNSGKIVGEVGREIRSGGGDRFVTV